MRIVLSIILASSFFVLQAQEENRLSTHQMFLNQYRSWQKEHPEYFQPATAGEAVAATPLQSKTAPLRKEVFGYLPYWMLAQLNNIDYSLLSTIAYFDIEINGSGDVTTDNGWSKSSTVTSLIDSAHAAGVRVVLCMTNFTASQISSIINTPSIKKKVIDTLYSRVVARNGDGVNIDFENISSGNRDSVTSFMRDLAAKFHAGRPLSHVSCAPTDYDFRQGDWDVKEISKFTEALFMQGYGYGWSTAPIAEPVGLLPTGTYWGTVNITTFINAVLAAAPDTSRIILGLPHFGYDWPTASSGVKANTTGSGTAITYPDALTKIDDYGRQWDVPAMNPWYRYQVGTQWHQGWYDDAESMSKKYQFAESKKLGGVGMWSLGMDQSNHDIWDALTPFAKGNPAVGVPHLPRIASMTDASSPTEGKILFRWFSTGQSFVKGYRLFMSTNGTTWSPAAFRNENTIVESLTDYTIGGLGLDSTYYFKFVAVDSSGSHASDTSDTYGVHTGARNRYLIVDGFDRYGGSGSWQKPQHDFVRYYGDALTAAGKSFDAAANEAVAAGGINLNNYSGVIWFVGDESTADRTFNSTEQNVVKSYLEGGGRLFVTGSEIAYELIGRSAASPDDKAFFTNYFKATWGGDKADSLTVTGTSGQMFGGISATFGQTYPEDSPDYFVPESGAVANLQYTTSQIAGLNYSGTFGSGTKVGALVYLGFPFETIASLAQRTSLIAAIVHYFETAASAHDVVNSAPGRFLLEQNFPNPFNPVTHFQFGIAHDEFVSLKIFDVLGKEVANLVDEQRSAGRYGVRWDASNFSSGVYFYRLRAGDFVASKKLILLK